MTKKRNAILVSGFVRDYEKTLDDFNKNLRNRSDVDLFMCLWNYQGVRKFVKDTNRPVKKDGNYQTICLDKDNGSLNLEKVVKDYRPTDVKVYDLDETTSTIEPMAKVIELTNATPVGLKSAYQITRTSLMFYMFREVFSLMLKHEKANDISYEKIVRARTDFVQGGFYPKIDWNKDFNDAIYVGSWNWSGIEGYRINDHFAISDREKMSHYFNFYDNMFVTTKKFITNELGSTSSNGKKTKAWSPEHMLSIYLKELGIKWKPIS